MTASLPQRLSAAAHAALPHANPLGVGTVEFLVERIAARRPRTAVDLGCGFGPIALALAARTGVDVLAVDASPPMIERGRAALDRARLAGSVRFVEGDASGATGRFDAVVCVGSSHVFGPAPVALQRCLELTEPDGVVLFADLEWTAAPPAAFLAFLGTDPGTYWNVDDVAARVATAGGRIADRHRATPSEWDAYEDAVLAGRLRFADGLEHAGDSEPAAEVRARANAWFDAYRRWARTCLTFAATVVTPDRAAAAGPAAR